jgi:pantoate--beta-alanine ligase
VELFDTIAAFRAHCAALRAQGRRIGLVPTMGYLHEGHASLLRLLRPQCDHLTASIFVNPAQFGPAEDLERYPRDLERDLAHCRAEGVDAVLAPAAAEAYPPGYATWVEPGAAAARYCGASRPGHFRGVLSIVLRLFNWSRCHAAAFGAKDAQQLWLVRRMVQDLALEVEIVEGPTVREADGLALSSRNVHLSAEERRAALAISRSLGLGRDALGNGSAPAAALELMLADFSREPGLRLDYLHVADWATLDSRAGAPERPDWRGAPVETTARAADEEWVILAAAHAGRTRLIDNMRLRPQP